MALAIDMKCMYNAPCKIWSFCAKSKILKLLRICSFFCLFVFGYYICWINSSMFNWSTATGRRKYCKWRQSGDMLEQYVGYCVRWLLEKCWSCCGVPTAGILNWRSATSTFITVRCFVYCMMCKSCHTDIVTFSSAHFGAGRGPIHLYNCNGRQSRLAHCTRVFYNPYYQCRSHLEDAGVRCQGTDTACVALFVQGITHNGSITNIYIPSSWCWEFL